MAAVDLELFCSCVNVCIKVKNGECREVNQSELDSLHVAQLNEERVKWLKEATVLDKVPEGEFTQTARLELLTNKKVESQWLINSCLNCGMETYALPPPTNSSRTYFLSKQLISNYQQVTNLKKSPNYSLLYQILISDPSTKVDEAEILRESPLCHMYVDSLKQLTAKLLNYENELMMERIRDFEKREQSNFSQMKLKAQEEQHILKQIVLDFYGKLNRRTTPPSSPVKSVIPKDYPLLLAKQEMTPTKQRSAVTSKIVLSTSKPRDTIFCMDEDEELEEEIEGAAGVVEEEAEEEENEEDDECFVENLSAVDEDAFLPAANNSIYATSLPIAMPNCSRTSSNNGFNNNNPLLDEDYEKVDDPQWIAASIQALAMSVRGDGSEMFGARPRPRLNTMD